MASSRKPARRTFADHFQATFGHRLDTRKLRSRGLLALGVVALLSTGAASADWRVYDSRVKSVLDDIKKQIGGSQSNSVNTNLDELNDRLAIIPSDVETGKDGGTKDHKLVKPRVEPDDKLDADNKARPTAVPESSVGMAKRCPAPKGVSTGIPSQQHTVCQEMYKTEIARYRFSLEMYELAETRNTKLHQLIDERNGFNDKKDFGKMSENTNKLLALQVQMDNDRDRYNAYMQAYQARRDHLEKTQTLLAEQAMGGSGESAGPLGPLVGAAALVTALEVAGHGSGRGNPFE